jgi:hypothetical protein
MSATICADHAGLDLHTNSLGTDKNLFTRAQLTNCAPQRVEDSSFFGARKSTDGVFASVVQLVGQYFVQERDVA